MGRKQSTLGMLSAKSIKDENNSRLITIFVT